MTTPGDPAPDLLGSLLSGAVPADHPDAGQGADPHAGHGHGADVSVRPAVAEDAPLLAALQLRAWRATFAAAAGALDALDPAAISQSWAGAITSPPTRAHHVLSACAGMDVVGFAALAPAEVAGGTAEGAGPAGPRAEILALEVDPAHTREGHGSRLLAACADLARDSGAQALQLWAAQDDEVRTRFLTSAGFAPAGIRRTLDVPGGAVVETCWYALL
ncbi:GNAT family N-acetyltransferase [Georgenia faecalis]|uniref:GNAT family N-acetyltransferase n=1 Tax=Georgenia faecalis TaxID=2483799 RepID=UPI001F49DA72|nr:GNAT family N-acetyltransferase [Georgenia faecalis]